MPRAKQRTPELRDRLLATAVEILSDGGAESLTTREVAARAGTSVPALYELFGDKTGLVRELFFEGFRRLGIAYAAIPSSPDPAEHLHAVIRAFRRFATANPALFEVMYATPFADFRPGPDELRIGAATREAVVHAVERCIADGLLAGDAVDISHGLLALTGGLATQEIAGWLGTTPESVERRWDTAVAAYLRGLEPRSVGRSSS